MGIVVSDTGEPTQLLFEPSDFSIPAVASLRVRILWNAPCFSLSLGRGVAQTSWSAVSQTSSLHGPRRGLGRSVYLAPAGRRPAIQQVGDLRYAKRNQGHGNSRKRYRRTYAIAFRALRCLYPGGRIPSRSDIMERPLLSSVERRGGNADLVLCALDAYK